MFFWILLALIPYFVQAVALAVDEFYCHMRRGLPRWERLGHPLDTLSVLLVNALAFFVFFSFTSLGAFVILALISCLFVTKDEWIHSRVCDPFEHWLHSILFVCHPLTFVSTCIFWIARDQPAVLGFVSGQSRLPALILGGQVVLLLAFLIYQVTYWNVVRPRTSLASVRLNPQGMQSASADPRSSVSEIV